MVFYRDSSQAEEPKTLLQYLNDTRHCKASDSRDKIFAVLGLTPEGRTRAVVPDYSTSARDLFVSVAVFFIERDRNLDLLCHCFQKSSPPLKSTDSVFWSQDSPFDLPSWVPDWSLPRTSRIFCYPRSSPRRPYYKASAGRRSSICLSSDHTVLMAGGKRIDHIAKVGAMYDMSAENGTDILRQWHEMVDVGPAKTIAPAQGIHMDKQTAYLETLIASPAYSAGNPHITLHAGPWLTMLYCNNNSGTGGQPSGEAEPYQREKETNAAAAMIFQDLVNKACHGRRFYMTKQGRMGTGPAEVNSGDTVAVLFGGQVPFVLCGVSGLDGKSKFTLVGECYVHGLMGGEAMEDEGVEMELFEII